MSVIAYRSSHKHMKLTEIDFKIVNKKLFVVPIFLLL